MTGARAPVTLAGADGARATISPFGAHVLTWTTPDGREQLYLSDRAVLDGRTAIRGGIPVIFPQFAAEGPLPKHGLARTAEWRPVAGDGDAMFELVDTPATVRAWPHAFRVQLRVRLLPGALETALLVTNTGRSAFAFTAALHTYLAMDDAFAATVTGLDGLAYRDSITRVPGTQREPVLAVEGAVNRVYAAAPTQLEVRDGARSIGIETSGFRDVVVWNPGPEGEAGLGDMAPGDSRRMLCVEPAVIETPVRLEAGERWAGEQRLVTR